MIDYRRCGRDNFYDKVHDRYESPTIPKHVFYSLSSLHLPPTVFRVWQRRMNVSSAEGGRGGRRRGRGTGRGDRPMMCAMEHLGRDQGAKKENIQKKFMLITDRMQLCLVNSQPLQRAPTSTKRLQPPLLPCVSRTSPPPSPASLRSHR